MVEYWKYIGYITLPTDVPSDVKDEWANTLAGEMSRIYQNLTTKIASEDDFKSRIADASSERYDEFLASVGAGWDANIIKLKQRIKLARAYPSWQAGISNAFGGTEPYFDDRVLAKKDKYSNAKYVLAGVGLRYDVAGFGAWRPIVKGVLLMRGDTRVQRYLTADDSITGTLESVFDPIKGRLVTPSIIAHAVQAVVMAFYANEAGDETVRDNILSSANTVIDEFVNLALDDVHKGSGYDATYVLEWDTAQSKPKVTVTDVHP